MLARLNWFNKFLPEHLQMPVFLAVFLHFILIIIFFVKISSTFYRMNNTPLNQQNTIEARAVTEAQLNTQSQPSSQSVQEAEQQVLQTKTIEIKQEKIKQIEIKQKKIKEEKQKLQLQLAHEKKMRELKKKRELEKEKALALKKTQQEKKALKQALLAKEKKLQNTLMQQQMNNEQARLNQIASSAQKGVIDQYKAQMLSLIQSNWRISEVNDQLKCVYEVNLAPGGAVLSATLMKSSGDSALDESARVAIFKSSPLPVPENPALFSNFRHLTLTLSPQGYVNVG